MKAIILSAGQGSRLLPLTVDRPKCLIELEGRTVLDWQLDMLGACGVEAATVVAGFHKEQVDLAVARRGADRVAIATLFNPFYKVADNLASLWMAREAITGDCLILNGDTLVSKGLVARVVDAGLPGIAVTVDDEKDEYDADDMKVVRTSDGRLQAIGKKLDGQPVDGESIGLIALRGDGAERLMRKVEAMMHTPEGTTSWYLQAIHRLALDGRVETFAITGEGWAEIDCPEDLPRAKSLVAGWR